MKNLLEILKKVNSPCKDDGFRFTVYDKINAIKELAGENYYLMNEGNLYLLYAHKDYNFNQSAILISSHIDEEYDTYFYEEFTEDQLLGTFDNSICNAVVLYLMKYDKLPQNVLIAFTGDEEEDSKGAKEISHFILNQNLLKTKPIVVVTEITSDDYYKHPYTVENYFIRKKFWKSKKEFKRYIRKKLHNKKIKFVHHREAEEDESWEYDEHKLIVFSFCLPTKPHPENKDNEDWMHDDRGIIVNKKSLKDYTKVFRKLLKSIAKDIQCV